MPRRNTATVQPSGSLAYVLKGWPRRSELFIASEIYRLEQLGFTIRLFVIKPPEEREHHPVVDRIAAQPCHLPGTTALSHTSLPTWLRGNLRSFLPALGRTLRHQPRGLVRAFAEALAQAVRARRSRWGWPRKVYVKEFLQAIALVDAVRAAGDVRHLHAHFAHGATTVAWFASVITGIPFSFTAHAKDVYRRDLNPAGLLRRKLYAARFAVTCTEANRAHLRRIAPRARVHRVYHGLNADFARLLAQQAPAPRTNGTVRLLGVGRVVPKKGFDTVVEACRVLDDKDIPVDLVLVGEAGAHSACVRDHIRELGLDRRVRLQGPATQLDLFRLYARANVFVLPCRVLADGDRDGIPNVLVEAMASGLPVVSTPVCGIPELVQDGVNGLLVPPDDPEAVARAVERLYNDRGLAHRLGAAAAHTVATRFDGERLVRTLGEIFAEALG